MLLSFISQTAQMELNTDESQETEGQTEMFEQ